MLTSPGDASVRLTRPPHTARLSYGMESMTTTSSALRKLKDAAKSMLPAPLFLSLLHHKHIGRYPNLFRPTTFNEKILQKSLRPDPWLTELTDKLTVRDYVARKLGESHLIPLLAAPETFTKEVFDALPDSFVMKANHGSSYVKVVTDKSATSFEALQELANHWLSLDFYKIGREKHYRPIKPHTSSSNCCAMRAATFPPTISCSALVPNQGGWSSTFSSFRTDSAPIRAAIYTTSIGTTWTWPLVSTNPVQSRRLARTISTRLWTLRSNSPRTSTMSAWTCIRPATRFTLVNLPSRQARAFCRSCRTGSTTSGEA